MTTGRRPPRLDPSGIWHLSMRAHARGHLLSARILKTVNFFLFHAVLPFECRAETRVNLLHRGLGVVVHPNAVFGRDVTLAHNVTIAAGAQGLDAKYRISVGDGAFIGASALIIAPTKRPLVIGRRAIVAAGAVVKHDVPDDAVVAGPPARRIA